MSSDLIAFVAGGGANKEVFRAESDAHGLSTSAYCAASMPIDRSGASPVIAPRRLTPEMVYIASDRAGFLGTLSSALRGRLDGKTPERGPVGTPFDVVISPRDAAKALLSRVVAGTLTLGPEQLAIMETLRSPENN